MKINDYKSIIDKEKITRVKHEVDSYISICERANRLEQKKVALYIKSFGKETSEIIARATEIDEKLSKLLKPLQKLDKQLAKFTDEEKEIFYAYFVDEKAISTIYRNKIAKQKDIYKFFVKIQKVWFE